MGAETLRVAIRGSPLSRTQTEEALQSVRRILPAATFEIVAIDTPGDRDLQTPLTDPTVPDDFFTRDIDQALLRGAADLAVHSAKDLPKKMPEGLLVAALLPALDIREALVLRRDLPGVEAVRVVGTSSPRREEVIRAAFPDAQCKSLRGTIDQRLDKLDRGEFDALVVAACALIRLGHRDRIHSHLACDPVPQQGRLAITVSAANLALAQRLAALDVRRTAGLVALVGCPAAADLLGRRASVYLDQAEVVFHDRLVPDEVLASIGHKAVPVGKTGGQPSTAQAEIHRLLLHEAEKGKLVVRLHGGDPGIYGHLGEELEFLQAWDIRTDVVPAVTAAQLASAEARSPLTHRGEGHRVTFISARPTPGIEVGEVPPPGSTNIAVYMGVAEAASVQHRLRAAGWPDTTSVIIGERLGYSDEHIIYTDVANLAGHHPASPAVFLIGTKVVPPSPATLFVGTGPEHFLRYGPLIHFPLIHLESLPLAGRAECVGSLLPGVRGVIFPSRFAVHSFMEALLVRQDVRALGGKTMLAVGPATAQELRHYGLRPDLAADHLGGVRELARKLGAEHHGRFLYPCSSASPREHRIEALRQHGLELVPAVFYENRETPHRALPRRPFGRVLFTSSSTVQAYFGRYPAEKSTTRVWLAVGPSTQEALQALGLHSELIA